MTRNKTYALRLVGAILLCCAVLVSSAPVASAQSAPSSAPPSQPILKTQFIVQQMSYQMIQVRGIADMREAHTFTFAPEIRDQMQKVFSAGGYQYGDKVVVWYRQGTTVALKIKGKPSKAK